MYFFGRESALDKKVELKVKDKRKTFKRKAVVIYDDKDLIVVEYIGLGWREAFNQGDFTDGTVRVLNIEGSAA